MTLKGKQVVIASMAAVCLLSLLLVQWMEIVRRGEESGSRTVDAIKLAPADSRIGGEMMENIIVQDHNPRESKG